MLFASSTLRKGLRQSQLSHTAFRFGSTTPPEWASAESPSQIAVALSSVCSAAALPPLPLTAVSVEELELEQERLAEERCLEEKRLVVRNCSWLIVS